VPVRRALRILSIALITAGLVILGDVGLTLAWQEPVSSIYGSIKQGQAADSLDQLEESFPTKADLRALDRVHGLGARTRLLAERFADRVETGQGIGRIRIPSIGVSIVVVQGTDTSSLQRGPGHYPETAFPGEGKTIGIAGHRTTYLAPFRHIDQIDVGDDILIEMPYAAFTYRLTKTEIVDPGDVQIVRNIGRERIVLTACHPLYSAAQRIAVFGRLTGVSLFAGGEGRWADP
jgi:sortase A